MTAEEFQACKEELVKRGFHRCRIGSGSMEPLLRAGDEVLVLPVANPMSLRRFDLVVFLYGEVLYCHYVWELFRNPDTIQTRSLRMPLVNDLPTSPGHILGLVKGKRIGAMTRLRIVLRNFLSDRG